MAEQDDKTTDEVTSAPETAAAEQAPEPAAEQAPEPAAEATEEPAAEATEEPAEQAAPAAQAPAPRAEPQEVLAPKERRARKRAAKAAKLPARGPRTPEERQADRDAVRATAARARRASRAKAATKHKSEAHNRSATPPREHVEGRQKVRQGIVVSDKADKTITVRIDVARRHRRYEKIVRTSQTLHAHDESNDAHTGDTVTIREARPLSRLKRWRLIGVVERAK
jgi:small subunit ribosomal protein S17